MTILTRVFLIKNAGFSLRILVAGERYYHERGSMSEKNSHKLPNVSQRIPHSKRRILQSVKPNEHPENLRLFCQVAVITRWQYYWGGQKAGFHWTDLKPILHTHLELSIALSILEKLKKNLSTLLWPSSLGSWGFMILGLKVINGFSISRVFVTSNKPRKAEL